MSELRKKASNDEFEKFWGELERIVEDRFLNNDAKIVLMRYYVEQMQKEGSIY